jgi:surface antigen
MALGKEHKFPYGYCTWYVATKVYVPYGGHAIIWLENAKKYKFKTYSRGKKPSKKCIVVFGKEYGGNGHVALVEKVSDNKMTISEMNYIGLAKKSERTIRWDDPKISGFIFPKQAIKNKYKDKDKSKYEKYKKQYKKDNIWLD